MRKPKFKVGQVVSVKEFYGNFQPGETGPGFKGKHGWRHGWAFGKIVNIIPPDEVPYAVLHGNRPCYILDGSMSIESEYHLRALTARESGRK